MAKFANIIIDISHEKLDKTFQYGIPPSMENQIFVGVEVLIPFGKGNREISGYVVEVTNHCEYDPEKIKYIIRNLEERMPIESRLIQLAAFIKRQYGATMIQALKTVIPIKNRMKVKENREITLAISKEQAQEQLLLFEKKHSTARARLLDALLQEESLREDVVLKKLNITVSVVRALEQLGLIHISVSANYRNPVKGMLHTRECVLLNEEQQQVVDGILENIARGKYYNYLIHGVTGSGKTEVYMELIADGIARGKQSIVLIPEIALTYQTVMRFYGRFGERVSIINSRLSQGEKYDQFQRAKRGEIDVVIGPRSALFTPFLNLGFIIVDEEHETSYKSESVPRYHVREVAIKRAKLEKACVVFGSATPSLEAFYQAQNGVLQLYTLTKRVSNKPLPTVYIADLREELREGNRSILSRQLQTLIEERLEKRQQTMLFINRRGIAGFVSCRACGHVMKCPHCDVSLSEHSNGTLVCHYCNYQEIKGNQCPTCGSKYLSGFKAGTQKIELLVKQQYPKARVLRMDMDTTRTKEGHEKILAAFANQEADILIGTQMIVKGHDFPNVTLVGILAADLSLHVNDYHAAERTFQLLTQAAGRAGRGSEAGEVVIQTYTPDHYSILSAKDQDYHGFFEQEILFRKMASYPPIWHILAIHISSKEDAHANLYAGYLKEQISMFACLEGTQIIGPADANIAKINDIYRKRLFIKQADYDKLVDIKDLLELYLSKQIQLKDLCVQFDFDPMTI